MPQRLFSVQSAGIHDGHRVERTRSGVARVLWWGLGGVALAASVAMLSGDHARSWFFFEDAVHHLVGPDGGIDLYRDHPEYQFGPIAVLVAAPLVALPDGIGEAVVVVVGSLCGVLALWCGATAVERRHPEIDRGGWDRWLMVAGPMVMVSWLRLAAYTAHLDDVILLTALAASGLAIERRQTTSAAVFLALAAAVKPWGVVFVPLALLGGGLRPRRRALLVGLAAAATWMPFVIGSPGTISALRAFALPVDPNSGLRALGRLDAAMPGWDRPLQLGLAVAVTTFAVVRRGSWSTALLVGVAVRLALDPATNHYYTTGLVLAGVLWEADRWPGRLPWRTAVTAVLLEVAADDIGLGGLMPSLRLLVLAALVAVALIAPRQISGPALGGGTAGPAGWSAGRETVDRR